MSESQNIEWKQSWHDDYLKWICGFANAVGGKIYIGKDDLGNVLHLLNYKDLMDVIPNKVRDRLGIICQVNLREEVGQKYIEIVVPPYEVAVSLRGRYYYRSGSVKLELTGSSLNEFLLKKSGKSWDDVLEPLAQLSDIDEASLNRYLEDAATYGRLPDIAGLNTAEILEKLRLSVDGQLKRAALILFGKDPGRFYPNVAVKIGRFGKDSTDLKFQEVIEGNLIQLLYQVIEMLGHKFLIKEIDFKGIYRVEKGEYPAIALREMLLNSLIHRSYMGAVVQIRVFDSKITIWNEGALPFGLTVENLKQTHNSRPRNPILADVCFKGSYIDAWGRGTLKIFNACQEADLPEPEIMEMDGGLFVRLSKTYADEKGRVIGEVIGGVIVELTKRQVEVATLLLADKKISLDFLAERLEINRSAVSKHINVLKERGVLVRVGGTRGYWKLVNPDADSSGE